MTKIANPALAPSGEDKIQWVASYMPLLNSIKDDFQKHKPFTGLDIAISIHLEAKTAYLAIVLAEGGANVHITGSNPLSTQDDIAAALAARGFDVNAVHGADEQQYLAGLKAALACHPHLILDDGGDFVSLLHGDDKKLADRIRGGCEETTTGILRLKARANRGRLDFPMVAVNDADCKHLFDNRYGTGQSALTAIMAVTNLTVASRVVVVAGYGWCGKGVAMRAKGMGARVIVTEVDPVKAIEAVMDGFQVMPMIQAAPLGDLFISVTGCRDVITKEHMFLMKDGAMLANAGHFDCEVNKRDLADIAERIWERKPSITGYQLADGRILNLLAEGRLVNLAAGMGHPAEIMDMSFAIQARTLEHLAGEAGNLAPGLYQVPRHIDQEIAALKLSSLGVSIDRLTPEQEAYLNGEG